MRASPDSVYPSGRRSDPMFESWVLQDTPWPPSHLPWFRQDGVSKVYPNARNDLSIQASPAAHSITNDGTASNRKVMEIQSQVLVSGL